MSYNISVVSLHFSPFYIVNFLFKVHTIDLHEDSSQAPG